MLLTVASLPLFAQTEKQSDIVINKKPFSDFGRELKQKIENKEIDLDAPFVVEINGTIDRTGKLSSVQVIQADGDQKVTDAVKDAIEAFSDSGWLQYLQSFGTSNLSILAKQDDENVSVVLSSLVKSKENARTITSGLRVMFMLAADMKAKRSNAERDDTEKFLLRSITAKADNDKVVIEFFAPKNKVREIIERELAKH